MARRFLNTDDSHSRRSGNFLSRRTPDARPSETRQLRLGVDYGTSRSKLVITDYGAIPRERSFVVRPPREFTAEGDFRIPSTVSVDQGTIHFGFAAEECADRADAVYRSLKMLCAYPDHFYGDHAEMPPNLNARDLATLYVGHLIQLGQQAASRYSDRLGVQWSMGVTLGVPMAQLDDDDLARLFVSIAREAFSLKDSIDLLDGVASASAADALMTVRKELSASSPEEPRDWVRSEAEAALFWAYRSPEIPEGRYACIDVGAGTTSASWFHLSAVKSGDDLMKERLSFYGAECEPPACDAIDDVLADHLELSTRAEARGREMELLERLSDPGTTAVDQVLDEIAKVFGTASAAAFKKQMSVMAWRKIGRVFFLGGGSKIDVVRQRLVVQKEEWLSQEPLAEPGMPTDLTEENGDELHVDPTFLLVAYGLSRRLAEVPDSFRPGQISDYQPRPPTRDLPSRDDLYSK